MCHSLRNRRSDFERFADFLMPSTARSISSRHFAALSRASRASSSLDMSVIRTTSEPQAALGNNTSHAFAATITAMGTSEVQVQRTAIHGINVEHPAALCAPVLFQIQGCFVHFTPPDCTTIDGGSPGLTNRHSYGRVRIEVNVVAPPSRCRGQSGSVSVVRLRLQFRQLLGTAGIAQVAAEVVTANAAREADQDRGQSGRAFALCGVPDGRSGCAEGISSADP